MALKKGIDVVLLYRLLDKQSEEDAKIVTYQTEHTLGMSRSTDATETKDGTAQNIGAIEYALVRLLYMNEIAKQLRCFMTLLCKIKKLKFGLLIN